MVHRQQTLECIATQLDLLLDNEVERLKHKLLFCVNGSPLFKQLVALSPKARNEDHEQLARALLEAKLVRVSSQHLIEVYAKRFIHSEQMKHELMFDKSQEPH